MLFVLSCFTYYCQQHEEKIKPKENTQALSTPHYEEGISVELVWNQLSEELTNTTHKKVFSNALTVILISCSL
jgi:hypothetical protein